MENGNAAHAFAFTASANCNVDIEYFCEGLRPAHSIAMCGPAAWGVGVGGLLCCRGWLLGGNDQGAQLRATGPGAVVANRVNPGRRNQQDEAGHQVLAAEHYPRGPIIPNAAKVNLKLAVGPTNQAVF